MMKILITGGTGLLGSHLSNYLLNMECKVIVHGFSSQADISADLSSKQDAFSMLDNVQPDAIVNLVCLSNVDLNEKKPNLAYRLNVRPLENIVAWKNERNKDIKLIQISTDHLYDNKGLNNEENIVMRNTYVLTKYAAELIVRSDKALILRTNFFGKSRLKNRLSFSDWAEKAMENNESLKLFNDVYFSPLSLQTLVEVISFSLNNFIPGVYNVGSHNGMSKAEFVLKLADKKNMKISNYIKISVDDLGLSAVRPKEMMMDVTKFEKSFNLTLPTLDQEIDKHLLKTDW